MVRQPILVVSLDFELRWGVFDSKSLDDYRGNVLGARQAIPKLLALFETYDIHATWATVGFLFAKHRREIDAYVPENKPGYSNHDISPYEQLKDVGPDEQQDPFHYANSLVDRIVATSGQEIATHTFSHYNCLANGQTESEFRADLNAALEIGRSRSLVLRSLVFPRDQVNYLKTCQELGISAYRGADPTWIHPKCGWWRRSFRRALRVIDSYFNIAGHHTYPLPLPDEGPPYNLASSRFLRPVTNASSPLACLARRRVVTSMRHAANAEQVFHLWWHPHNFGKNSEQNLRHLRNVLEQFVQLRDQYGMRSMNMHEVVCEILESARAGKPELLKK